ncbi:MAG TPA: CHAT domain-containing protein, partial [Thermoanaerobaculia bacterium]|nr:CHAT domain-containing protein [Thermoanaerobaculia bacterium]
MRYQDLTVEIRPNLAGEGGGPYRVDVRSDAFGRGTATFELPSGTDTEHLLRALEYRVARSAAAAQPAEAARNLAPWTEEPPPPPPPAPTDLGTALFSALFRGKTLRVLDRCLAHEEGTRAETGEERGLRLRFVFDPSDAELPALAGVPWELLYHPDAHRFLARSRHTPVVRTIAVPRPAPPLLLPADRPLRVLLVEASPTDQRSLATGAEAAAIEDALGKLPGVEVVRASHADLGPLHRDHLRPGGFHAVHFMGHGDFDDGTGEAVLCFERPDRTTRHVPAALFSEHVEDAGTVRLVVLNACLTGALPRRHGQDPFTAAATALVIGGTPAVVAMQLPISDRAAVAFATELYRALARREHLSAAVAAGRLAICRDEPDTLEWATPVLYLRGDDELFELPQNPAGALLPHTRQKNATPEEPPLRLGVRSLVGHGHDLESKADRPLSLVHHFDGPAIRDPARWHQAVLPELR